MDCETGGMGLVWEISKATSPRALPDMDLIYTEVGSYKGLGSEVSFTPGCRGRGFFPRLSQEFSEVAEPVRLKTEGR